VKKKAKKTVVKNTKIFLLAAFSVAFVIAGSVLAIDKYAPTEDFGPAGTPPAKPTPVQTCFKDATVTSALLESANSEREKLGIRSLVVNEALVRAAQLKSQDMITRHYVGHHLPGESTWNAINQAGYNYRYAGENIAEGWKTALEVHNGWMGSPEHKKNIMNPNYTEVGFAVVCGVTDKETTLVVAEYGSPK